MVSGGHTAFYQVTDDTTYREIGGTRDDAAGEAFDKIGRVIGMPYPGGAALDQLANDGDPAAIRLPSPALPGEEIALSFSGIKTAALNYLNGMEQKGQEVNRADVAASYTAQIVSAIAKKTALALRQTGASTLVLAGGVAANSHLRAALTELCGRRKVRLAMPTRDLCGDNGAMVAAAGYFEYLKGNFAGTSLNASALDDPEAAL